MIPNTRPRRLVNHSVTATLATTWDAPPKLIEASTP